MGATVKRKETESWGRGKEAEWLRHVSAKAVLKDKWGPLSFILIIELQSIVFEVGHDFLYLGARASYLLFVIHNPIPEVVKEL